MALLGWRAVSGDKNVELGMVSILCSRNKSSLKMVLCKFFKNTHNFLTHILQTNYFRILRQVRLLHMVIKIVVLLKNCIRK